MDLSRYRGGVLFVVRAKPRIDRDMKMSIVKLYLFSNQSRDALKKTVTVMCSGMFYRGTPAGDGSKVRLTTS